MLHTFHWEQVVNAIIKVLNKNYDFIADVGRYITVDDIESFEVWYIGLRIKFKPGVYKYRYRMVSKTRVCEKLSPNKQEVTFTLIAQTAFSPVEVVAVSQNQSGERFSRDRSQYPKNYAANVAQDSSAPAATIRIIKPNGAWRFMQGDKMLVAVYLEVERDLEAQKFIEQGHRVEFEDPTTGEISLVKLVNKKIEYMSVRKVS